MNRQPNSHKRPHSRFEQISKNNLTVDHALDKLVNLAIERPIGFHANDQKELEKTSHLLLMSSLILGDSVTLDDKDDSE